MSKLFFCLVIVVALVIMLPFCGWLLVESGVIDGALLKLETENLNAQAASTEAETKLTNARAVELDKQADLVTAEGNARALTSTVETANNTLALWGFAFPLAPPVYIGFGVMLGLCIGVPVGALWMSERKRAPDVVAHKIAELQPNIQGG